MADVLVRARPESCLSDLALDRMIAGELATKPELATAKAHLATCDACAARAAELQREHDAFATSAPPLAEDDVGRLRSRRRSVIVGSIGTVAAAAIIMLVAWPRRSAPPAERTKGGLALAIVARHPDGRITAPFSGDALSEGDAIRFEISTDEPGFLGIIGLDAKPSVSPYVPPTAHLPAIGKGRDQVIEGSIVLDETLGAERIFAVVCARETDVADVVAAGQQALDRAGGSPIKVGELPTECRQTSFLITKVPR